MVSRCICPTHVGIFLPWFWVRHPYPTHPLEKLSMTGRTDGDDANGGAGGIRMKFSRIQIYSCTVLFRIEGAIRSNRHHHKKGITDCQVLGSHAPQVSRWGSGINSLTEGTLRKRANRKVTPFPIDYGEDFVLWRNFWTTRNGKGRQAGHAGLSPPWHQKED